MKTFSRHRLQCLLVLLASALSLQAKVRLPGVFSDHMVLQRDAAVACANTAVQALALVLAPDRTGRGGDGHADGADETAGRRLVELLVARARAAYAV